MKLQCRIVSFFVYSSDWTKFDLFFTKRKHFFLPKLPFCLQLNKITSTLSRCNAFQLMKFFQQIFFVRSIANFFIVNIRFDTICPSQYHILLLFFCLFWHFSISFIHFEFVISFTLMNEWIIEIKFKRRYWFLFPSSNLMMHIRNEIHAKKISTIDMCRIAENIETS